MTRRFSLSAVWAVAGRTIGRSSGAGRVLGGALISFAGGVVTVDGSSVGLAACDAAEVEKRRGAWEKGWNCLWVAMCGLNWDRRAHLPLARDDIVFVQEVEMCGSGSGVARGVGIRAEVWIPEATPEDRT